MSLVQRIIQRTRELLRLEESSPKPKPTPSPLPVKPKPKPKPAPKPKPRPSVELEGIDYSFGSGLTAKQIKDAGKHFVCRYLAESGNPKDINQREVTNLLNAGLFVVLVWETTADRTLKGKVAGTSDARAAKAMAAGLGLANIPIYFAADDDMTEAEQAPIDAYLDGCASVLTLRRVGLYGGYWVVKRAFDAKKITYGWQTYAWSGGKWDSRAQLHQYQNGVRLGPADVDLNRSTAPDFAQWPRP